MTWNESKHPRDDDGRFTDNEVDRQINSVRKELSSRGAKTPRSVEGWHQAWQQNPDLRERERQLFLKRDASTLRKTYAFDTASSGSGAWQTAAAAPPPSATKTKSGKEFVRRANAAVAGRYTGPRTAAAAGTSKPNPFVMPSRPFRYSADDYPRHPRRK